MLTQAFTSPLLILRDCFGIGNNCIHVDIFTLFYLCINQVGANVNSV